MKYLIVFILIFLIACNDNKTETAEKEPQKEKSFEEFLPEFIEAFNSKNIAELNSYLDYETGLYGFSNPGAFTVTQHFNSFDDIFNIEHEFDIAAIKAIKINCTPEKGEMPKYSCDDDTWSKEGCFWNSFADHKITKNYQVMIDYELIEKDKVDLEKTADADELITRFFYDTNETIGFYFGKKDGKWKLVAIDRVIPCSA